MSIRLLVVDDHETVRRGMKVFLRAFPQIELVGEATNGAEAVSLCTQLRPDVVLMDVMMPQMDGIAATRQIQALYPDIHILALTSNREDHTMKAMLQAGAKSYLLKSASVDELANTIINACS